MKTIVILIAASGLLLVAIKWAFFPWIPYRRLPRNQVRHLRLRLRLRLHPGPGHATLPELWLRWGRLAAWRRSARIRSSLSPWQRLLAPGEHSVFVGRAHWRHGLRVPLEEHVLVMAPPRTFKTAFLADVILRYPGPVIATTTKADVYELTSAVRAQRGPVPRVHPALPGRGTHDRGPGRAPPATSVTVTSQPSNTSRTCSPACSGVRSGANRKLTLTTHSSGITFPAIPPLIATAFRPSW